MSALIHTTALVDPLAQLHPTVSVGPYSIIGPDVKIDAHTKSTRVNRLD